jgi:hypothetical protein
MGGNPSMNARPSPTYAAGLRLMLLAFLLAALQPAPPLVTVGPPQTVQTTYPHLGVHTRLTDEVEEWKIKRTLEMVREMGATTIIEFFPWAYYQAEDGGIAWDHPDMVIDHAHAQGLQVIARIGLTPDWARPPDTPLTYLDATAYDDFAAFAAAFAARYAGRVQGIIIGNEPNLSYEWGYRSATAEDYAALLAAVYPAIKAADPTMTVLAGALAPTLEPDGSPWGTNDLLYLDRLYDAGAAPNFDALAVHVYGLTFPPDAPPDPGVLNFRRVELMREVMLRHGDADTPMMITETGWNDHPRWTQAVRPAQRLTYTLDALDRAAADWPYVELVGLWSFRYPAPTRSYMDYYTLVTPEFVRKPIYDALQAYTGNMPP